MLNPKVLLWTSSVQPGSEARQTARPQRQLRSLLLKITRWGTYSGIWESRMSRMIFVRIESGLVSDCLGDDMMILICSSSFMCASPCSFFLKKQLVISLDLVVDMAQGPPFTEAWFRRACALEGLGQLEEASSFSLGIILWTIGLVLKK